MPCVSAGQVVEGVMRRVTVAAFVAIGMMAVLAGDAERRPPAGAEETVFRLYRDFGSVALIEEADFEVPVLVDQPREVLVRYLEDDLVTLLLKDRECERREHAICQLDFDFMFATNGLFDSRLGIARTPDPAVVKVSLYSPQREIRALLRYTLRQTASGWRIHDVAEDSGPAGRHWSLLAILRGGKS